MLGTLAEIICNFMKEKQHNFFQLEEGVSTHTEL